MIVLDLKTRSDFYISANFKDIFAISDSIDKYLENNFPDYFISYQYKNDVAMTAFIMGVIEKQEAERELETSPVLQSEEGQCYELNL